MCGPGGGGDGDGGGAMGDPTQTSGVADPSGGNPGVDPSGGGAADPASGVDSGPGHFLFPMAPPTQPAPRSTTYLTPANTGTASVYGDNSPGTYSTINNQTFTPSPFGNSISNLFVR